jgi:hypothetical protein
VKIVAIALITVAALACGCSTSTTTKPISRSTSTVNSQTLAATLACQLDFAPGDSTPDPAMDGKTLTAAENLAKSSNQVTRVVSNDGSCNAITADIDGRLIDIWVVDGRVIKAVSELPPGVTLPPS